MALLEQELNLSNLPTQDGGALLSLGAGVLDRRSSSKNIKSSVWGPLPVLFRRRSRSRPLRNISRSSSEISSAVAPSGPRYW